jgi:D-alanyl-D-alanine carboxypeptidase
VLTALAVSVGDADARRAKKKRVRPGPPPPFSHIVLDAKSGKVLENFKADERRFPASLTKVMTLYLLFEQMESGKLKLGSRLPISSHAASRPPTKLGLKPGNTISVEEAIKALVTKSANDAAVVIAEAIGGSEREFARMMTGKARSLGMTRTVYANASGLPDPNQVTTARDQAILGRAIQWHFPRHYKYFATSSFTFHGREIHTHNRLLGQVKGVDGIKTGYTHASGFNLVTSVRRDRRHIVAVVIGGRTGRSRDAFMRKLIQDYIDDASPVLTAQPQPRAIPASASAADAATPPLPPDRPAEATDASASAKLAATKPGASLEPIEVVQIAGDEPDLLTGTTVVAETAESAAVPAQAAPPAHAAPVPPVKNTVVATDTSLGRLAARDSTHTEPVVAIARSGAPAVPGWFPYLLVAFIGCFGSLMSAFFTVMPVRFRRRAPQSA